MGQRNIMFDVINKVKSEGFAVFGDVSKPAIDRLADGGNINLFAMQENLAADPLSVGSPENTSSRPH
jgi:hypothetical protein